MPSISEAFKNANVVNIVKNAFQNTQANQFEYGGWIKFNAGNGNYTATSKTDNSPNSVMLSDPNLIVQQQQNGWRIIADFHCHPGVNRGACMPSRGDIANSKNKPYTMLVFTNPNDDNMGDMAVLRDCMPTAAPFAIDGESVSAYAVMWEIIKRR